MGELTDYKDELADWAKDQRNSSFFVDPDANVQAIFREIADHVNDYYLSPQAKDFLDGADPWVIAHAKCDLGTVVTWERKGGQGSKKVRIPNICEAFEVEWVNPCQMFRELGISFKMQIKGN